MHLVLGDELQRPNVQGILLRSSTPKLFGILHTSIGGLTNEPSEFGLVAFLTYCSISGDLIFGAACRQLF